MRLVVLLLALLMAGPSERVTVDVRLLASPGPGSEHLAVNALARSPFIIQSNLQFLMNEGEAVLLSHTSHVLPARGPATILVGNLELELRGIPCPDDYLVLEMGLRGRRVSMRVKSTDTIVITGIGREGDWQRVLLLTPHLAQ